MNFQNNPFVQAKEEVAKKSFATRIEHSDSLHVFRSAFSSKGSALSLGYSLATKGGAAALGKIPFVGGLLGLGLGWASGKKKTPIIRRGLSLRSVLMTMKMN